MNLINTFQKYQYLNSNKITSNKLYKPQPIFMYPVTKYTMPNYFIKEPDRTPIQKILYVNTDLEHNLDETVILQNLANNKSKKYITYFVVPFFIIFPFAYYNYYYR